MSSDYVIENGFLIERSTKTGQEWSRTPVPEGHAICDLCDGTGECCGWYYGDVVCEPCDHCDGRGHATPEHMAAMWHAWERERDLAHRSAP